MNFPLFVLQCLILKISCTGIDFFFQLLKIFCLRFNVTFLLFAEEIQICYLLFGVFNLFQLQALWNRNVLRQHIFTFMRNWLIFYLALTTKFCNSFSKASLMVNELSINFSLSKSRRLSSSISFNTDCSHFLSFLPKNY